MLGYEKEIDIFGLEMAVDMELYEAQSKLKHNVAIIKELSEKFNCDKKIVQQALNESLEYGRKMKWCEDTNHGNGRYIVSDDYGGPESGYMGYHCKKCGFSQGQHLY